MAQIWSSLRVLYAVKILSSSDPYQLTFYYSIWSGILSNIQSDILSGILFAFYLCVRVRAFYAPHSSPSSPWVSSEIASLELSLAVRSVSVAMRQGGGWSRRKKERKGGARNCTVIKSRGLHLAAEKNSSCDPHHDIHPDNKSDILSDIYYVLTFYFAFYLTYRPIHIFRPTIYKSSFWVVCMHFFQVKEISLLFFSWTPCQWIRLWESLQEIFHINFVGKSINFPLEFPIGFPIGFPLNETNPLTMFFWLPSVRSAIQHRCQHLGQARSDPTLQNLRLSLGGGNSLVFWSWGSVSVPGGWQ